jgi:hypothetical protein
MNSVMTVPVMTVPVMTVPVMTHEDFDAASRGWAANKIRKGAMVYYACTAIQKNGKLCPLSAIQDAMAPAHLCRRHTKREGPEEGDHVSRFRISETKEGEKTRTVLHS